MDESDQPLPLEESETTDAAGAGHHQADGSAQAQAHTHAHAGAFRPKKKRGPPENGIPSLTKIMVANLPYELSEEKVCCPSAEFAEERSLTRITAQGTLYRVSARVGQDCPTSHPSLHGAQASYAWRASQGTWLWICQSCIGGDAEEGG